jgi:alkanesulfonate monooxygenase SsuD/methylene tetrahydromethanopterin reductase-like flavin-dependent oxidoreductase (luciferase family)
LRRARHPEGYRYQHHLGPLPVQQPHPPVLLGGTAAPALRRAGRLAQGWIASSKHDLTNLGPSIEIVREGARAAGRDPDALQIVVRTVSDLPDDQLAELRAQGVTEVFLDLNLAPGVHDAERALETFATRPRPSA